MKWRGGEVAVLGVEVGQREKYASIKRGNSLCYLELRVGFIRSSHYVLMSAGLPLRKIQYIENPASQTDQGCGLTKRTRTNTCDDLCYLHSYLRPISKCFILTFRVTLT